MAHNRGPKPGPNLLSVGSAWVESYDDIEWGVFATLPENCKVETIRLRRLYKTNAAIADNAFYMVRVKLQDVSLSDMVCIKNEILKSGAAYDNHLHKLALSLTSEFGEEISERRMLLAIKRHRAARKATLEAKTDAEIYEKTPDLLNESSEWDAFTDTVGQLRDLFVEADVSVTQTTSGKAGYQNWLPSSFQEFICNILHGKWVEADDREKGPHKHTPRNLTRIQRALVRYDEVDSNGVSRKSLIKNNMY